MLESTFPHVVTLGPAGTFSDQAVHLLMNDGSRIDNCGSFLGSRNLLS